MISSEKGGVDELYRGNGCNEGVVTKRESNAIFYKLQFTRLNVKFRRTEEFLSMDKSRELKSRPSLQTGNFRLVE